MALSDGGALRAKTRGKKVQTALSDGGVLWAKSGGWECKPLRAVPLPTVYAVAPSSPPLNLNIFTSPVGSGVMNALEHILRRGVLCKPLGDGVSAIYAGLPAIAFTESVPVDHGLDLSCVVGVARSPGGYILQHLEPRL
jgi:hypothetical protein